MSGCRLQAAAGCRCGTAVVQRTFCGYTSSSGPVCLLCYNPGMQHHPQLQSPLAQLPEAVMLRLFNTPPGGMSQLEVVRLGATCKAMKLAVAECCAVLWASGECVRAAAG